MGKYNLKRDNGILSDLNNNEFTFKFVCYALCVKDYSIQHTCTSDKKNIFFKSLMLVLFLNLIIF